MNDFKNMFGSARVVKDTTEVSNMHNQLTNAARAVSGYAVVVKPAIPARIANIGQSHTDRLNEISSQVLAKVKVADAGAMGKGITDILALTASVDLTKFNQEDKGVFGKFVDRLKQTKVRLLAQYETVDKQMGDIAKSLQNEIGNMESEAKWLETMYTENLKAVHLLQQDLGELKTVIAKQTEYVESLKAIVSPTQHDDEALQRETMVLEQLLKQDHRLEGMLQIGIMDAPDIRSLQKNNFDTTTDFGDIISVTLPLWRRNLSKALIAQRQVSRAEMGNAIKDRNNELMRKSADLMHTAGVKTAQLSQRSSVADMDTFDYAQSKLIDRMTQVRQIESNARAQRANDIKRLQENREKLKEEMRKW